ncbi:competence type IV pilus minor pilin ComGG [Streptococcus cameli]
MFLTKTVKAGTLLYALLMLAIFSLLVQFYLQTQLAVAHGNLARQEEAKAYLMADWVYDEWKKERAKTTKPHQSSGDKKEEASPATTPTLSGTVTFTQGKARYQKTGTTLSVLVQLDSGKDYSYSFSIASENK